VKKIQLPRKFEREIYRYGIEKYPRECCGQIGARDGELIKLFKTRNTAKEAKEYFVSTAELARVQRKMDEYGLYPEVIFHTHPGTEAYFSATDEKVAREGIWGPIVYIVASIKPDEAPYMKAFVIPEDDAPVEEVAIEIV
jgi:proteasome lid subunit RPN8/RPN11